MSEQQNQKHKSLLSKKENENIGNVVSTINIGASGLKLIKQCGAICKRIPFAGNVIDSALLYDESGSVKKSIIRFSVNSISGFADKFILIAFIFDTELGIWTYKKSDELKQLLENYLDKETKKLGDFFNDMFNTIGRGFRGIQNQLIFEKTGVFFGAYLELDKLLKTKFASLDDSMTISHLHKIKAEQAKLNKQFNFNIIPSTKETDDYFNPYFETLYKTIINDFESCQTFPIYSFNSTSGYMCKINPNDIESLSTNSPIHLLKALYFCEDFTFLDFNKSPSLNDDNAISHFTYHSSFYLSFIANKDSLSDSYLDSRKSLYKSIM